jgi:cytochrome c oxidase subunit 4
MSAHAPQSASDTPHAPQGRPHDAEHWHVVPFRTLIGVGVGLLILTWLTVAAVNVDLGEFNIYLALAIAVAKAGLVALYFMHLRWDRPFNGIVFIGSLAFVMLLIAAVMADTKEYQPSVYADDGQAVTQTRDQVQSTLDAYRESPVSEE